MDLREKLREEDVRPLIKHREFRPIRHAHNPRGDGPRYRQRAMCETVFEDQAYPRPRRACANLVR
jgi:IS5 family transposase